MVDVSVIIPTRNRPVLLERALKSVNRQTGGFSIECIVTDDGDPQFSDTIRTLVEGLNALYCHSGMRGGGEGGAVARNRGRDAASGEYLAFLDDDDDWHDQKIDRQLFSMKRNDCQISYTGKMIVSSDGAKRRYSFKKPGSDNHHKAIMRRNFIGTTSTFCVSTALFDASGGFDERLPALQDYDLYIRLLHKNRICWIDEPLTTYYTEQASENVSASGERFRTAVAILSEKYKNDSYYHLLKTYFIEIFLLKCVRSPRFFSETVRNVLKRS